MEKKTNIIQEMLSDQEKQRFIELNKKLENSNDNISKYHYLVRITELFLENNCWATAFDYFNTIKIPDEYRASIMNNIDNYLIEKIKLSSNVFNFGFLLDVASSQYASEYSKNMACCEFIEKIVKLDEKNAINCLSDFSSDFKIPSEWRKIAQEAIQQIKRRAIEKSNDYKDLLEKTGEYLSLNNSIPPNSFSELKKFKIKN